jgi:hypothetical protein
MEEIDEAENKAIKELNENGYIVYDKGIVFESTAVTDFEIQIIPWNKIRSIKLYAPLNDLHEALLHVSLWHQQSGEFRIKLHNGTDFQNIYKYLTKKFMTALIK